MTAFPQFFGNASVAETLAQMIEVGRIPQTILLSGPEGVGKATLARRFAAALLGGASKIECDDLSLPANIAAREDRDKWPAEKRGDDPLFFASHPDFVTFTPDGPLRQISIQQMRILRERAQLKPLRGSHRVFLIDRLDKANEQAANSLLKVLEEPPEHLIIFATVENLYDLLPTIRSRSIVFQLSRLAEPEMRQFCDARNLPDAGTRIALAQGSPGNAVTLDINLFKQRRELVLSALECGSGMTSFGEWVQKSEGFSARKSEKLDLYLKVVYDVLEDLLRAFCAQPLLANADVEDRVRAIARHVNFAWLERATGKVDELVQMVRRNIQKTSALDAFVICLRNPLGNVSAH